VITQKAQLALNRINREFIELSDVKDDKDSCIIYESPYGARAIKMVDSDKTIKLFKINSTVTSCDALSAGDTLADGVQSFTIRYNPDTTGTTSLWSKSQDVQSLYALSIQMIMNRPDTGGGVSFYTTISPRNNNNAGGATVPTPDKMPPDYASKTCFVATAAWGDRNHPVVELLREFRDRVLEKTGPGAAFVRFYYRVGPTLAEAIEDNLLACLAVRILITPLAGLAFFILYVPALIPIILVLSWMGARLITSPRARPSFHWNLRSGGERGAILLALIAALVIFSTLSAVMISMFGASAMGQAASNNIMRAYYLAESGFRYAASLYVNAADESARETQMLAMNNREYTLSGNDGKFRLTVYPYYYKYVSTVSTTSPYTISTKVPGEFPFPPPGSAYNLAYYYNTNAWVAVSKPGDPNPVYDKITGVSTHTYQGFNEVRFYKTTGTWDVSPGTRIVPACVPDRAMLTLTDMDGDGIPDLVCKNDSNNAGIRIFPPRNGTFTVWFKDEMKARTLRYRQVDLNGGMLLGVHDPSGGSVAGKILKDPGTSSTGPYDNYVVMQPFVGVESLGTFGQGGQAVSRKVTYETPIGYVTLSAPKTEWKESFNSSLQNWFTGSETSHIGTQVVEGGAMRLTGDRTTNVTPASSCLLFRENQIAVNWSTAFAATGAQQNFETEWKRAGSYLSYDVQTKIFLDSTNQVYSGGLSFRLDELGNSLGLSILSSTPGTFSGCDRDGIPDSMTGVSIVGQYNPYLILWMKEVAQTEQNISTDLSPHLDPASVNYSDPPPTGKGTRAILIGACSNWLNGNRVRFDHAQGSLPGGISAGVDYFIRIITYPLAGNTRYVYLFDTYEQAVGLGATPWEGLRDITTAGSGTSMIAQDPMWTKIAQQSLNYNASDVYRILKTTGGGAPSNRFRDWTTLKVRVIEAPSLSFKNGGGAGLEIVSGNTVYQTQDDSAGGTVTAIALVRNDPIYWSRSEQQPAEWSWNAGTAAGVLILEVLKDGTGTIRPYTFTAGKKLYVGEPPYGTWIATAGVPSSITTESSAFRGRDNWVQVFVGDKDGPDNPNNNPFDTSRALSPRDQIFWALDRVGYPGITIPSNDRFSLVRMSDYRNACLARRFLSRQNTETGTIGDFIRLGKWQYDGSTFYSTPTSGTTFSSSRPEIGLHSYGPADSMTNLYFDDFAVRFGPVWGVKSGFLMPVQR
jgi:hypothetical protein